VTIACASPGTPVNVYLVPEQDRSAASQALLNGQRPALLFDSKEKTEDATFTLTIPARGGCAVLLTTAGSAKVKLKITGK
jgi:hypothetical protein